MAQLVTKPETTADKTTSGGTIPGLKAGAWPDSPYYSARISEEILKQDGVMQAAVMKNGSAASEIGANPARPVVPNDSLPPKSTSFTVGRGEKGQAMTEYLALVVLCGLVCIPVVKWLPNAVRGYIRPFYYCISRPIP